MYVVRSASSTLSGCIIFACGGRIYLQPNDVRIQLFKGGDSFGSVEGENMKGSKYESMKIQLYESMNNCCTVVTGEHGHLRANEPIIGGHVELLHGGNYCCVEWIEI